MNRFQETADVVIVGSGLAGLAAACRAADAGAKTLVLEKMDYFGGNSALSGGGFAAWDSSLKLREKLGLGEDSWQQHMEDTLAAGKRQNDPALVEVLARNAPAAIDWLVGEGVPFKEFLVQLGGYSAPRSHHTACTGKEMMDIVRSAAEKRGVELRLGCRVDQLHMSGDGAAVEGLGYVKDGERRDIRAARAVILAAGGFGRDIALRQEVCPGLGEQYNCSNHPGATGEIIRLAVNAGADTVNMRYIQLFPCANPVSGAVDTWAFHSYSSAGFGAIFVDGTGRRFVNEMLGRDEVSAAHIEKCGKRAWAVLDQAIADKLGLDEKTVNTGLRLKRMAAGGTAAALAEAMGADPAVLEGTIARHNAAIAAGGGDELGKPISPVLMPMGKGPYYAISQWPSVHYTMGGLRIDGSARVLTAEGRPISRLFAAGEVCGGLHGANRLGGNALSECVVFGRIAGENAAKLPSAF